MPDFVFTLGVINSVDDLKGIKGPLHLAMGVFDGVHIGHQAVIAEAIEAAKLDGGVSCVLTFDPHPIRVLAPHRAPRRILASIEHKRELLHALGVDYLWVVNFTGDLAQREAEDFLADIIGSAGDLRSVSVGEDWKFGRGRRGDVKMLKEFGKQRGFSVNDVKAVMLEGERVSSTRVRQAIRDNRLDMAERMLGRPYTVLGTVVEGRRLGRTLGFPTANLRVHNEQLPGDGVWALRCVLDDGKEWCGAGNLGLRPTVEGGDARRLLEVHLLDFEGDLYGREMEVFFLFFIREEREFDGLEELQAQIAKDVKECRQWCKS